MGDPTIWPTLEQAICLARLNIATATNHDFDPADVDIRIAAAVRSFMGSDEVVERACTAGAAFCGKQWPLDFNGHEQEATRACTRTELSAAIGEPEGALRNPDA